MPSAVDIITYVGVPLAVVGVMPVLYTSSSALLTQYRVRRTVRKNYLSVTTRVGLLAGIVEVDLPRFMIHSLPRDDPAYWKQNLQPSSIKGGTWTVLNWQKVATGKASYRIQHSDELKQPQAEVDMADLITFLLDRGASPSPHGLHLLRLMGLQTPPTTPLLTYNSKPVLVVATPDESEGRLSLRLQCDDALTERSPDSLPPYWLRLSSHHLKSPSELFPPVRLFLTAQGLEEVGLEPSDTRKSAAGELKQPDFDNLLPVDSDVEGGLSVWFACGAVAVCARSEDGLVSRYSIPSRIQQFSKRDTIPHDILVLLGILKAEPTPLQAERERLRRDAEIRRVSATHQATVSRQRELQSMNPAERARAQAENSRAILQRMTEDRARRMTEELEKKADALVSPRVGVKVVAGAAVSWLREAGNLPQDGRPLSTIAAAIVHAMIFDAELASSIASILDAWLGWMDLVMTDVHFDIIERSKPAFCYAAILLNQIADFEHRGNAHPVARDLDECQRVWGKVYLG
ncbi:hypothetical protein M407DRAFT_8028 [Tulasnella calospora MUT 4182]|uniref:Uncharacterized protein n=2 Tax=Tulasnella calospora MUT 4182 TaxID=1051891 RepID=A0A0C3QHH4_9AGAM|nr:hypothetical protein M407DRAFT_8028 [Tulasnella calospora MUT 4182]